MSARNATTVTTYALLCLAGGVSFMIPDTLTVAPSAAQAPPDSIFLRGTVRDFYRAHPDMEVTPSGGDGHFAGNHALALGADDNPVFNGGGYKVDSQWTNSDPSPIAPHLYRPTPTIQLTDPVAGAGAMDTWSSLFGAYGGTNVGPAPLVQTAATLPSISAPTTLGPSVGDVQINTDRIISSDLHCDELHIKNGKTVQIDGDVTILCEEAFSMANSSSLEIAPGSTLTMYLRDGAVLYNAETINVGTDDPTLVTIYVLGTTQFEMKGSGQVYAQIVAPTAQLDLKNNAEFFGTFVGESLDLGNGSVFHYDDRYARDACGVPIIDHPGTAGLASTGGISSAATFDQWYNDELNVNLSMIHYLSLTRSGGVYQYLDDSFYPIDDTLFGNEGAAHNSHFTYEFSTSFTYDGCTGQYFEFEGNDDVFVYVDDRLAIDRGGVGTVQRQYVDMDRLDLVDGESYLLRFFYANRSSGRSVFRIRTNIEFDSSGPVSVSAGFD